MRIFDRKKIENFVMRSPKKKIRKIILLTFLALCRFQFFRNRSDFGMLNFLDTAIFRHDLTYEFLTKILHLISRKKFLGNIFRNIFRLKYSTLSISIKNCCQKIRFWTKIFFWQKIRVLPKNRSFANNFDFE